MLKSNGLKNNGIVAWGATLTATLRRYVDASHSAIGRCRSAVIDSPAWRFNLVIILLAATLYSVLAHVLFSAIPRLDDSVAAVFQARIFAEGKIVWPLPADLHMWFDMFGVITPLDKPDYRAGMYPPGWPLLLVPGVMIGATWLVNPILAGLMLVAISMLGEELFNRATGRIAAVLGLCSPFVGAVAATQLSHISAALFITLAWWCALRLLRTRKARYAILGGLCLGFTLLIRPETAVLVGLVIAVGVLIKYRQALAIWRSLVLVFFICLLFAFSLLVFQDVTVGAVGKVGHSLDMEGGESLGFGKVPQTSYVYTVTKAVDHTARRFDMVNKNLLGWPLPALILILAPFFLLPLDRRDFWLFASLVSLSSFYFFYWYFEYWLHARYLFPAVPALLILAARGALAWQSSLVRFAVPKSIGRVGLGAACVYALTVGGPNYYEFFKPHHADVEDILPRLIESAKIENALVFYHSSGRLPGVGKWNDFYATAASRNSLNLDGDIVFVRDGFLKHIKRRNVELIAAFPNRNYYLYDYDQSHQSAQLWRLVVEDGRILSRHLIAFHDDYRYIPTDVKSDDSGYHLIAAASDASQSEATKGDSGPYSSN